MRFDVNEVSYEIEIKKVGQEHCLSGKKREIGGRECHSLHFVSHGYGILCANDERIPLSKGNVFLLYAGEKYEYFPDSFDPWSYLWVDFYGDNLDGFFETCGFTKKKPHLRINNYSNIMEIMKNLLEVYDGSFVQSMMCSAYTLLLFGNLIEYKNKYARVDVKGSMRYKQFRDILIYIDNNYRMDLSLKQISESFFVTEKQLLSLFRDFADTTPINYINKFRVSAACEMLRESSVKIETVAEMVGVDDEKYFARMFTKWCGMSPKEYRKNCPIENPFEWLKEKNIDFR